MISIVTHNYFHIISLMHFLTWKYIFWKYLEYQKVQALRFCLENNPLLNLNSLNLYIFCLVIFRSSHSEVFFWKYVLKISSKFTGEHPLLCSFIEMALRYGCSLVNLLHIFRTPFPKNTTEWLLLNLNAWSQQLDVWKFVSISIIEYFVQLKSFCEW